MSCFTIHQQERSAILLYCCRSRVTSKQGLILLNVQPKLLTLLVLLPMFCSVSFTLVDLQDRCRVCSRHPTLIDQSGSGKYVPVAILLPDWSSGSLLLPNSYCCRISFTSPHQTDVDLASLTPKWEVSRQLKNGGLYSPVLPRFECHVTALFPLHR